MKIGVPKGLFFYYYSPLWETFFQELGLDIVFSPQTTQAIVEHGVGLAVDEACLPIKAFYGHVDYLKDIVDYIFIPRFVSIAKKEYICPKFMGLPDMIRQKITDLPTIIEPVIDCSKSKIQMEKEYLRIGKNLSLPPKKVKKAWQKSIVQYESFKYKVQSGHKYLDLLKENSTITPQRKTNSSFDIKIGLLGHGYNIYDPGLSMDLISRLEQLGSRVFTSENILDETIEAQAKKLPKPMFWTLGKKALGATMYWVSNGGVDGIIYLSAFGCGPDSLVGDLIERYCHKKNYPVLMLTVDEHTGEAGMATRIEAFIDLLERRSVS
jgi:predicted nucleotide-binding protein (sugar kinase/HSP70/actin superfamily)